MKLCIIASGDYFSSYGGGQIYVKNLVQSLKERGHDISVISLSVESVDQPTTDERMVDGINIIQLKLSQNSLHVKQPLELQPFLLDALKGVINKIHPDIIHAHGWKYATSKVCDSLSVPCVITSHHGGIVCPNGMLLNNHDAICSVDVSMKNCLSCALHFVPAGDLFAPLISHLPQKSALKIAQFLKGRKNIPYISPAFQTPLGIAHKLEQLKTLQDLHVNIIAPSRAIASALKRNGIADDKITVIPHGITPLTQESLEPGLPDRPVRFGYVGRVAYAKGLHVLIDALKLLSKKEGYELHVYGEGANKNEKRYVASLQKETQDMPVIWHGKIDNSQVQKAYQSFDVMVHPAIYLEVFGLTLLESLSSGRPVIATRCGGPEDFIEDGVDGFLIEPNDVDQLAQAIKKFLDEPSLVEKLSKTIRPINTLENHTTDLEKLYKEVGLEK